MCSDLGEARPLQLNEPDVLPRVLVGDRGDLLPENKRAGVFGLVRLGFFPFFRFFFLVFRVFFLLIVPEIIVLDTIEGGLTYKT